MLPALEERAEEDWICETDDLLSRCLGGFEDDDAEGDVDRDVVPG